jgi:hypothetical protein
MNKPAGNPEAVISRPARPARRLWILLVWSPMVSGFLGIVCFVVLFYAEENWRGKRVWERCKRDLAGQGAVMEPQAHATISIPDNLNVLKAPGMSEWFLGQAPNELASGLSRSWLSMPQRSSGDLIEITVVSRTNPPASFSSDLCLDYDAPVLAVADPAKTETIPSDPPQVIPLIVMDSVPLQYAIKNLARQDGRKYLMDSNLLWSWKQTGPNFMRQPLRWLLERSAGRALSPEPCVNIRWENVTAFQALMTLLDNYNLAWIEDSANHIGRICIKSQSSTMVQLTPGARERVKQILRVISSPPVPEADTLRASQGFVLYRQDNSSPGTRRHPVRITVRTKTLPDLREVESFFPRDALPRPWGSSSLGALPSATNTFRVFANPSCFCPAEDYLAQTDPCKPQFDLMREALKRPYALMDAGCERPVTAPPRNFVGFRVVSQALAQRAQSYLLLGQPERALEELTLIHDLAALLEVKPFSPVAAMIEGAITGMYVEVIRDGLRLGAWREPQLIALQGQLEKIHLGPLLVAGLSSERSAICRTIESARPSEFAAAFDTDRTPRNLWEEFNRPGFFVLTFAPRGWRYQSMAASASLLQSNIACFDRVTQTVRPREVDKANSAVEALLAHGSPTTRLAGIAIPSFARAWQTMARNQTSVDQAFIACALEGFRLAHGEYPPDLAALAPEFADRIPRGIFGEGQFHYRRLDATHFTLYSVGWNGKDEGGLASDSVPLVDRADGNWVWN